MSKLKILLITFVTVTVVSLSVVAFYWPKAPQYETVDSSQLFSEETRLWGKAVGPVQVRLEFKEQIGNRVIILGQIRSTLPQTQVEWKLPPGVRLVDGSLSEVIQQQTEDQVVYDRELTVEVDWPLEDPYLVLRAAESTDSNAFGASTVFNLDPNLADMEKEEIIRAHMKSRKLQKLIK